MRDGRSARAHTMPLRAVTSPLWTPWVIRGRCLTVPGARAKLGLPKIPALTIPAPTAAAPVKNLRRLM